MADFDPDQSLDTPEQANGYVRWCSEQFTETLGSIEDAENVPFGVAVRAAGLMLVIASAPLHLDDDYDRDREQQEENLGRMVVVARETERQTGAVGVKDWIVARSVIDCYLPVGQFAAQHLDATKCALGVLILWGAHPFMDLGPLHAPDAWALLVYGYDRLTSVEPDDDLGPWDFAVTPNQGVVDKARWQQLNNSLRDLGAPPMSPN